MAMNGPLPSVGAKRRAETIPSTETISARCVSLYHLWYSAYRSGETGIVATYMIPLGTLTSPVPSRASPICGSVGSRARPGLHLEEAAGVDAQLLAGDVTCRVAGQKQHRFA